MGFVKNLERERILLSCWKQGLSNRETALKTGIPEGTVNRYFARFNKHPEKYSRETSSVKTPDAPSPQEIVDQTRKLIDIEEVTKRHRKLMEEGKFLEAKQALEADRELENYISSRGTISASVYYAYDEKKYALRFPEIIRNSMEELNRKGYLTVEFLDILEKTVVTSERAAPIRTIMLSDIEAFRRTLAKGRG